MAPLHDVYAVVMAAGRGTRMRSHLPKPLVPVAGRAILSRLLDGLAEAGVGRAGVVVGFGAEQVRAALAAERWTSGGRELPIATPEQTVRDGTAAAVACAEGDWGGESLVFVAVGDSPLLRAESLRALVAQHRASGAACTFLTATFGVQLPYARVIRGPDGGVVDLVEERDCRPEQLPIREYLTTHVLFDADALWRTLPRVPRHPRTGERYLTDAITLLIREGARVEACAVSDWRELVGLNTPEEVAWAEAVLAGTDAGDAPGGGDR